MVHDSPAESLYIGELVAIVRRRLWLLIISTVLSGAAGLAVAYLQTPVYEATTIIELAPTVPFTSEMQGLVRIAGMSDRLSSSERMEYAAALKNNMTTRSIIYHLTTKMDLSGLLEQRAAARLLAEHGSPDSVYRQEVILQITQILIANAIKVKWVGRDQLEVTYASSSRAQARDLLSHLADRFIEERALKDLEMARTSMDFADVQLKRYDEALKTLEEEQAEVAKQLLLLKSDPSLTADANTAAITQTIENVKAEIVTASNRETSLLQRIRSEYGFQQLRAADLTSESVARDLTSDSLLRLQGELTNVAIRMGELAKRFEWSEFRVLNLRVQQNDLLGRIAQESKRVVSRKYANFEKQDREVLEEFVMVHAQLKYLNSKRDYLETSVKGIDAKYKLIPEYESRLKQIERSIFATSDLRERFRRQQESSLLTQDVISNVSIGRSRIVEPAKLPLAPVSPNKTKIFILALLLGLTIGVGAIVTAQVLDQSFYGVEEVKRELNLEVLSVVPAIPYLRDAFKAIPKK